MEKSEEEKIVDNILNRTNIISGMQQKKSYTPAEKQLAIMIMEFTKRDYQGRIIPNFMECEELLAINHNTLKGWWERREEIKAFASEVSSMTNRVLTSQLEMLALKISDEFNRRDLSEFSPAQLVGAMRYIIPMVRLFQGKSTQNVSHNINTIGHV